MTEVYFGYNLPISLYICAMYCNTRTYDVQYNSNEQGERTMAVSTKNISIRMDADLKTQADALFAELGMNMSTAFNIFVRQALREGKIPFDISLNLPNKETIAAMIEAERIGRDSSVEGYSDLDELFSELKV